MATVVALHAHPDDEVLFTGGTLARAAAEGHRVVVVVATDGLMGAAGQGEPPRMAELRASAAVLGAHRVHHLGYADSGHGPVLYTDPPDRARFVRADPEEAAERLAAILRVERPDVLLTYDRNGGNGHRDHVRVHEVGARAARLAGVPRVLEATLPRVVVTRLVRLVRLLRGPSGFDDDALRRSFSPRAVITHRVDVRRYARKKLDALAAHRSQVSGSGGVSSVMRVLVRLPGPVLGAPLGWEWFVEASDAPVSRVATDILRRAPHGRASRSRRHTVGT